MDAGQAEVYIQGYNPASAFTKWVAIGASVQGASHIQAGLPCQDFFAYRPVQQDILIAAIADGLGSEPRSSQGAHLASETSIAFLENELRQTVPDNVEEWNWLLQETFLRARQSLEQAAEQDQAALREYGTTLLLVVIAGDWLAAGQIGDGAAVALLEDGSLLTICTPQSGEYINETYPLTLPNLLELAEFSALRQPIPALALMTDGMCHISLRQPSHSPHLPFFQPLFQQLPGVKDAQAASLKLAVFMESERVCSLTDDDKILLLIGRKQAQVVQS